MLVGVDFDNCWFNFKVFDKEFNSVLFVLLFVELIEVL